MHKKSAQTKSLHLLLLLADDYFIHGLTHMTLAEMSTNYNFPDC